MANDQRLRLFKALDNAGFNIGSYDDFDRRMNNAADREKFYNAVDNAGFNIGNREDFEKRITPSKYSLTINGKVTPVSERQYKDFASRHQKRQPSTVTNAYEVGKNNWRALADEDEVKAPASIARPTDTYSTPGAIQRVAEQNRKDNYGQKVVDNVVTATRQEEERRNQPVAQTGNEGVDTYLMKTQGQLEDDIAKNLGGYQSQVQEFTQGVLKQKGEEMAADLQGRLGAETPIPGDEFGALFNAISGVNKDKKYSDKEKSDAIYNITKEWFGKDETVNRIAEEADKLGMDREVYAQYVANYLKEQVPNILHDEQLKAALPKSLGDDLARGFMESVTGGLYKRAMMSREQRDMYNEAEAVTAEGANPYYNRGTVTDIVRFGEGLMADALTFKGAGAVANVAVRGLTAGYNALRGTGLAVKMFGKAAPTVGEIVSSYGGETAGKILSFLGANSSKGQTFFRSVVPSTIQSSITLGLYDNMRYNVDQMPDIIADGMAKGKSFGEIAGEVIAGEGESFTGGAKTGAMFGFTAGASRVLGSRIGITGLERTWGARVLHGAEKAAWKLGSFTVEAGIFAGPEMYNKWQEGKDVNVIAEMGKGAGMAIMSKINGFAEKTYDRVLTKKETAARRTRIQQAHDWLVGHLVAEDSGLNAKGQNIRFTKEEKEQFLRSATGRNLVEKIGELARPEITDYDPEGMRQLTALDEFFEDKTIPWNVRAKVMAGLGDAIPMSRPRMERTEVTKAENGWVLREYGKDNELLSEKTYKSEVDADTEAYSMDARQLSGDARQYYNDSFLLTEQEQGDAFAEFVTNEGIQLGVNDATFWSEINDPKSETSKRWREHVKASMRAKAEQSMQFMADWERDNARPGTIRELLKKDPEKLSNDEVELLRKLRRDFSNYVYKPGELHIEQAETEGRQDAVDAINKGEVDDAKLAEIQARYNAAVDGFMALEETDKELYEDLYGRMTNPSEGNTWEEILSYAESVYQRERLAPVYEYMNAMAKYSSFKAMAAGEMEVWAYKEGAKRTFVGTVNGEQQRDNMVMITDGEHTYTLVAGKINVGEDGKVLGTEDGTGAMIALDENGDLRPLSASREYTISQGESIAEYRQRILTEKQEEVTAKLGLEEPAATEKPAGEAPQEKPVEEAPAEEAPAAEKPATEQPVGEQPAVEAVSDDPLLAKYYEMLDEKTKALALKVPKGKSRDNFIFQRIRNNVNIFPKYNDEVELSKAKENLNSEDPATRLAAILTVYGDKVNFNAGTISDRNKELLEDKEFLESHETLSKRRYSGYSPELQEQLTIFYNSIGIDTTFSTDGTYLILSKKKIQPAGEQQGAIPTDENGVKQYHLVDEQTAIQDILNTPESKFIKGMNDPFAVSQRMIAALREQANALGTKELKKRYEKQNFTAEEIADITKWENDPNYDPQTEMGQYLKALDDVNKQIQYYEHLNATYSAQRARELAEARANSDAEDQRRSQDQEETKAPSQIAAEEQAAFEENRKRYQAGRVEGKRTFIYTADGEKIYGHYVLHDASDVAASHNSENFEQTAGVPKRADGSTMNDNDYKNNKHAQQTAMKMGADYDGRALDELPVVTEDGVVISGNNRTISRQIAARGGTDAKYLADLRERAEDFGFTEEQLAGKEHPTVSFEPEGKMDYTTETYAKFNKIKSKQKSETEQSVVYSKRLAENRKATISICQEINRFDTLNDFYGNAEAQSNVIKALVENGIWTENELALYQDKDGGLTRKGEIEFENLIRGVAFGEETIRVLDSRDMRAVNQTVLRAIPAIVTNGGLQEYSLQRNIEAAIKTVYEAITRKGYKNGSILDYFLQNESIQKALEATDESGQPLYSPEDKAIIVVMADLLSKAKGNFNAGSVKFLQDFLENYNNQASQHVKSNNGPSLSFDEAELATPNKDQIIKHFIENGRKESILTDELRRAIEVVAPEFFGKTKPTGADVKGTEGDGGEVLSAEEKIARGETIAFNINEIKELDDAPRSVRETIADDALSAYNSAYLKVPSFQFGVPEEQQERMTYEKFHDEFMDKVGTALGRPCEPYLRAVYDYIDKKLEEGLKKRREFQQKEREALEPRDDAERQIISDVEKKLADEIAEQEQKVNEAKQKWDDALAKKSESADIFGGDDATTENGSMFTNSEMGYDASEENVRRSVKSFEDAYNAEKQKLDALKDPKERDSRVRAALEEHRNQTKIEFGEGGENGEKPQNPAGEAPKQKPAEETPKQKPAEETPEQKAAKAKEERNKKFQTAKKSYLDDSDKDSFGRELNDVTDSEQIGEWKKEIEAEYESADDATKEKLEEMYDLLEDREQSIADEEYAAREKQMLEDAPLTDAEIDSYDDPTGAVKAAARQWLNGVKNDLTKASYLEIYEHVRNHESDGARDSADGNAPHMDGGVDDGTRPGRGGGETGQLDQPVDEGAKPKPSGEQDGTDRPSSPHGEGGNRPVAAGKPSAESNDIPKGRGRTGRGSTSSNGNHGERPGASDSGSRPDGRDTGGKSKPTVAEATAALDDALKDLMDGFGFGDESRVIRPPFSRDGKGIHYALGNNRPKRLGAAERAALMQKVAVASGTLVRSIFDAGVHKIQQVIKTLKDKLEKPLRKIGYNDADLDRFIDSVLDVDWERDGEVHTVRQWLTIADQADVRKALSRSLDEKRKLQKDAEGVEVKVGDEQNISDTLPFLLPEQQDDVYKTEVQFFDPKHQDDEHGNGKGMLFTNGTGTGKTYTGLGIAKRFIKQGKGRILIVTPTQEKVTDWSEDAKNLGIKLTPLEKNKTKTATQVKGEGAVVTTYANFRQNKALMEDDFDLVIYDESHRLMESKDAKSTAALQAHYRITNKDLASALDRLTSSHPLWLREDALLTEKAQYAGKDYWTLTDEEQTRLSEIENELEDIEKQKPKVIAELTPRAKEAVGKTKTVFLSATPFNTRQNIEYAEGYLFSYGKVEGENLSPEEYASQRMRNKSRFFTDWFGAGSEIKNGKVKDRVSDEDAVTRQEIAFAEHLMNDLGTMSGRVINNGYDYSRDFPITNVRMSNEFNDALRHLMQSDEYNELAAFAHSVFGDYQTMSVLYETMKVSAAKERIQQHLDMGRKVVIFHRRVSDNKGLASPPFARVLERANQLANVLLSSDNERAKKKGIDIKLQIKLFQERNAALLQWEQELDYRMPRAQLRSLFGDAHEWTPEELSEYNHAISEHFKIFDEDKISGVSEEEAYKAGYEVGKRCFDLEDVDVVDDYKPHQEEDESDAHYKKRKAIFDKVAKQAKKGLEDAVRERIKNGEIEGPELDESGKKIKHVGLFAGEDSKNAKHEDVVEFNNGEKMNIIVVQEASGKEGISLHDQDGKHPRVMINLALPQSPISFIQAEGRIYRIGNKSNAIFEYPLLGIDNEVGLFAQYFNGRAGTTENLALGEMARGLKQSITRGILQRSGTIPLASQGVGGKEFDARSVNKATGYDNAIKDYNDERMAQSSVAGFAEDTTPEPLGYKMVEWAEMKEGESALEPSAGMGSISRYIPSNVRSLSIETDQKRYTRLLLSTGAVERGSANAQGRRTLATNEPFENLNGINKYDTILMNPPTGEDGQMALDHFAKALVHLNNSGRLIAILPDTQAVADFVQDTVDGNPSYFKTSEVYLPTVAFSGKPYKIVVIDKVDRKEMRDKVPAAEAIDLRSANTMEEFFGKLRDVKLPNRTFDPAAAYMRHGENAKTAIGARNPIFGNRQALYVNERGVRFSIPNSVYDKQSYSGWRNPRDGKKYYWMQGTFLDYDEIKKLSQETLDHYQRYSDFLQLSDEEMEKIFSYASTKKRADLINGAKAYAKAVTKLIRDVSGRTDDQLKRAFRGEDLNNPYPVKRGAKFKTKDLRALFEANNQGHEERQALFDKVMEVAEQLGMETSVIDDPNTNVAGYYQYDNTLTFNAAHWNAKEVYDMETGRVVTNDGKQRSVTLLHELIHAVTVYADWCYDHNPGLLTPELSAAVEDMRELHRMANSVRLSRLPGTYFLSNHKEFFSEMANDAVRDVMQHTQLWVIEKSNGEKRYIAGDALDPDTAADLGAKATSLYNEMDKALDKVLANYNKDAYEYFTKRHGGEMRENAYGVHYKMGADEDSSRFDFEKPVSLRMKGIDKDLRDIKANEWNLPENVRKVVSEKLEQYMNKKEGDIQDVDVTPYFGKEGKTTAKDVLTHISENSTDADIRKLASYLLKNLGNNGSVPVSFINKNHGTRGQYFSSDHSVRINKISLSGKDAASAVNNMEQTIVHEIAHAVTVRAIEASPEARKAILQIYKDYVQLARQYDIDTGYAAKNPKEFVAEFMGRKAFREALLELPANEGEKNIGQRILDFIKKHIFRMKETDTFFQRSDEAIKALLDKANSQDWESVEEEDEYSDDVHYKTSREIDELYPNWLEGTTTDSGKHSTQVEGTRKTYRKVGEWIAKTLGKDVKILDASSGMGYGTSDLREQGFNIEDVEPYQSEERKKNNPATYSSYGDIKEQYDYIISNAVLNVIPDDWRADVLHNMVSHLRVGGRLFINTRKAGEEKNVKDKIELDSPQEILVKRNGRIASYQRFFTPKELKEYVEKELGEGYEVEIANEKNSGTKGLAAVVVTKTSDATHYKTGDDVVENPNIIARVHRHAEKVAKGLGVENDVKIHDDVSGISNPRVRADIEAGKPVMGWFDEADGSVHLYTPNISNKYDAEATIRHEHIGHKGMRGLMGEQGFRDYMHSLWYGEDAALHDYVSQHLAENKFDLYDTIEEFLSEAAEKKSLPLDVWFKVRNAMTNVMEKAGFSYEPSIADVKYMVWLSKNRIKGGDPLSEARRNAMRWRLAQERSSMFTNDDGTSYLATGKSGKQQGGDGVHYATGSAPATPRGLQAKAQYHRELNKTNYVWTEAYVDYAVGLKKAMEAIAGTDIMNIKDSENAYLAENQMSSVVQQREFQFNRDHWEPLNKAVNEMLPDFSDDPKVALEKLEEYMRTKHGLERNREFFVRDWLENKRAEEKAAQNNNATTAGPTADDIEARWDDLKTDAQSRLRSGAINFKEYLDELTDFIVSEVDDSFNPDKQDRSGLAKYMPKGKGEIDDAGLSDEVMSVERKLGRKADDFWDKVNGVTKYGVNADYESGIISKENKEHVDKMFAWYVPLRGFSEEVANEVYDYVGIPAVNPVSSKTIVRAKGRGSESESPLAVMAQMSVGAISRGVRNEAKQRLLRFVRNHTNPKDKNNLITESSVWLEKVVVGGKVTWEERYPQIKDDATPDEVAQAVEDFNTDMKAKAEAGEARKLVSGLRIPYRVLSPKEKAQHIVEVNVNGEKHLLIVNGNPRAAQAMNGLMNPESSSQTIDKVNRFMSSAFTTWNPSFVASNTIRDAIMSRNVLATKENGKYVAQYVKNWHRYMWGKGFTTGTLWRKYHNGTLDVSKEDERYFKEFMENGGETGFVAEKNVEKWKKEIMESAEHSMGTLGRAADKVGSAVRAGSEKVIGTKAAEALAKYVMKNPFKFVEDFNERAENMARFATYMTSRQMGRGIVRSIQDAKDVSVNFNRKGAGAKAVGNAEQWSKNWWIGKSAQWGRGAYLFFNAGCQSLALLGRNIKNHPIKTATFQLGQFFLLGLAQNSINQMLQALYGDDDTAENAYANLPEWTRRNNICIFAGHNNFVKIPLPIELRAFYGLGDVAAGYLDDERLKSTNGLTRDLMSQTSQLFPVDYMGEGGSVGVAFMPDLVKPLWHVHDNRDWTGKPIQREETQWNKYDPGYTKAFRGENRFAVNISKKVNELTGGDDVSQGWLERAPKPVSTIALPITNPAYGMELIDGYAGGMGKTFIEAGGIIGNIMKSDWSDFNTRNVPIAKALFQQADERTAFYRTRAQYFKYGKEFEQLEHDLRGYKKGMADPLHSSKLLQLAQSRKARQMAVYNEFEKKLKKLRKARNTATAPEQVKLLDLQENQLMEQAVKMVDQMK